MEIACIGGAALDITVRLGAPARLGTSNPAVMTDSAGGVAANVARSLARLGVSARLFSCVGGDDAGDRLLRVLDGDGVDAGGVEQRAGHSTARYVGVLDADGSLVLGAAAMDIFDEMNAAWLERVRPALETCDVWVADANVSAAALDRLAAARGTTPLLVDPVSAVKAERVGPILGAVTALFPDATEAAALSGMPVDDLAAAADAAARLRGRGVGTVVITLGADGVLVADAGGAQHLPARPPPAVVDVTGAGDALVAGYVYGLVTAGEASPIACGLAAARLAVGSHGSVPPDLSVPVLLEQIGGHGYA